MMDKKHHLIVIAGPTAVGKTDFAINIAQHFNTVIISADSRQCFKELNIGVARPSQEELNTVPHYFIADHSITSVVNAASYEQYTLSLLEILFQKHNVVVLVGGTGLYIKALLEGLDTMPDIPESVRNKVVEMYDAGGLESLYEVLSHHHDSFLDIGEIKNKQRVMRAVEVLLHTGKSIVSFKKGNKKERSFDVHFFGMDMDRTLLYQRINKRVDRMMEEGLLEEVKSVAPFKSLNALQTVGYKELFAYLDGACSLDFAVEEIKKNTRHYAKRQMTWFKKQENMIWLNACQKQESSKKVIEIVNAAIS